MGLTQELTMILSFIHSMHKITESELQNVNQGILVPHFYNMMHTTKLEKKEKEILCKR